MGARGSPSPPGRGLLGRWPWLPTAVVGLLAVTALGGPVFLHPTRAALGSAWSEGPGHLWGLWCTTLGLWDHGPFLRVADIAWPDGFTGHLMDPVNLLVFGPFYALGGGGPRGAALGWNALHVAVPIAGAAGCWSLGRRLAGDHPAAPWAIALLAAVVCMSPYMLEFPFIGRTEFLPAMLVPGHVALLHRWMRAPVGPGRPGTPEPPPPWPVGLAAGLTLGGVALGGWYLAAFVACLDVPLGLWLACGRPWREALGRLALVVAVAAACVTPAAIALLGHPPAGSAGFFPAWPTPPPTSSHNVGGLWVSVAGLVRLPDLEALGPWMDPAPYVGIGALALSVVGAIHRPRRAGPWLLLTVWLLWLSAGTHLAVDAPPRGGTPATTLPTPVSLIQAVFPILNPLQMWSRIAVVAALPAGVGALWGFLALAPRQRLAQALVALGLLGILLADQATWPRRWTWQRPSMAVAPPADLLEVLDDLPTGPVIQFPLDTVLRERPGPERHGHYLLWQLVHGRPISSATRNAFDVNLEYSTLTRTAVLVSYANVRARGGSLDPEAPLVSAPWTPSATAILCARADVPNLRRRGYLAATLQADLAGAVGLESFLVDVLGPPSATAGHVKGWNLSRVPAPSADATSCRLPALPEALGRFGGLEDTRPRDQESGSRAGSRPDPLVLKPGGTLERGRSQEDRPRDLPPTTSPSP